MLEIERKFLVKEIPNLEGVPFDEIEQGYLSFTPEIRIRRKGKKYFLTKKSEGTQIRSEIETEIDDITYEILATIVKGRVIKKTRYKIALNEGLVAEFDIYHDDLDGLFTVETEFPSPEVAESFLAPSWFGEDITEDKRYKNKNLAQIDDINELLSDQNLGNNAVVKKELKI